MHLKCRYQISTSRNFEFNIVQFQLRHRNFDKSELNINPYAAYSVCQNSIYGVFALNLDLKKYDALTIVEKTNIKSSQI